MSAKPKLEKLETRIARPQTRRSSRRASGMPVLVRSSHGERAKALIRDVSIYGCSLGCEAPWLRTGIFLSVHIDPETTAQAIVRWARDGVCGIEFLRPIADSLAEAIAEAWD